MAIGTPVLQANSSGGTTSAAAGPFSPPANCTLFALVGSKTSSVPSPPTISDDQGGTWTKVCDAYDSTDNPQINSSVYAQVIGASPPASMTVTASGGSVTTVCSVISITGIGTNYTNFAVATNNAGDPSATLGTAPASTSAVLGWFQGHLGNPATQTLGTELFDNTMASNYRVEFCYALPTSPPSSCSWTSSDTSSVGILLEVTDASAGGGGISGTGSGSLPLSGSTAGTVKVKGTATGTVALTGASTGTIKVKGTAAGTLPLSGSAAGTIKVKGTATGVFSFTGAAAGTVKVKGTATGTLPLSGSAASTSAHHGTATGTLPLSGAAAGTAKVKGAATGNLPFSGAASGLVKDHGITVGLFDLTGTATGAVKIKGAANGNLSFSDVAHGTTGADTLEPVIAYARTLVKVVDARSRVRIVYGRSHARAA